jgi:N-carbamoyl-L-amino-acid hydrolase
MSLPALGINPERFLADFEEMSAIGSTGDGGVDRPALSEEHLNLRAWFKRKAQKQACGCAWMERATTRRCCPADKHAKTLLLGSHLDSVPHGRRFDGALGCWRRWRRFARCARPG